MNDKYKKGLEEINKSQFEFILEELGDSENLRSDSLEKAKENFEDEDLEERFINEIGEHEAMDRAFIQAENVGVYLVDHPLVALDPESYKLAIVAQNALFSLYQRIPNFVARNK